MKVKIIKILGIALNSFTVGLFIGKRMEEAPDFRLCITCPDNKTCAVLQESLEG